MLVGNVKSLLASFLGCVFLMCSATVLHAADCASFGDDIPAADIATHSEDLYASGTLDLDVSARGATSLRLFYGVPAGPHPQQFALDLPPEALHPPTQTVTISGLKGTTTVYIVARTGTGATTCSLTVPFVLPKKSISIASNGRCPAGFAIADFDDSQYHWTCVAVAPAYAPGDYPDYTGYYYPALGKAYCGGNAFIVSTGVTMVNGHPHVSCRVDSWNLIDPISSPKDYVSFHCYPYDVGGRVQFAVAAAWTSNVAYTCASRSLQLPEFTSITEQSKAAAAAFAHHSP